MDNDCSSGRHGGLSATTCVDDNAVHNETEQDVGTEHGKLLRALVQQFAL